MIQIVYEYVHISASESLESFVSEKLKDLEDKYDFIIRADVFFKKENRSDEEEQICEIRLSTPGPRLFASSNATTFRVAASQTIKELERQLEKRKDKMRVH